MRCGNWHRRIARQNKKAGASAHANAPVCYQGLYELPVDPTSWIIYDLFDLKCIFAHIYYLAFCKQLNSEKRRDYVCQKRCAQLRKEPFQSCTSLFCCRVGFSRFSSHHIRTILTLRYGVLHRFTFF